MKSPTQMSSLSEVVNRIQEKTNILVHKPTVQKFEIFKGITDSNGKITRTKAVGSAYLKEGFRTYVISLKTLLEDRFYLMANTKSESPDDFVLLTREIAQNSGRKYFWNSVGSGKLMEGSNHGILQLHWDLFGSDFYMDLYPQVATHPTENTEATAA